MLSVAGGNINSGLMILTALVILAAHRFRSEYLPPKNVMLALLALFLTHALATGLSAPSPVQWNKFFEEMWFKLLLVAVPVVAAGRRKLIVNAVLLVVAAGVVVAFYAGYQNITGHDLVRGTTLHSTVGQYIATGFHSHHLSYGGQAMLVLAVAMAWMRHVLFLNPRRLWLPLLACLVLGMGLIWSFARSAQVGTLAAAVLMVVTLPRKWRLSGLGVLMVMIIIALSMPQVRNRVIEGFTDEKEVTRLNLWRSSLAGIGDRPVRGWGQGNFQEMLNEHEVPGYYESRAHSHNDYLMNGVNAGIPGFLAALWLFWVTVRHLYSGWRRGGAGSWVMLGALACQVAVAFAGIFQVYQTDDEPEMLLYFMVGCGLAMLSCKVDASLKSQD